MMRPLPDAPPDEQALHAGAPRGMPLPWWGKIGAKVVLSRVLPSYRVRKALGLFVHGSLDQEFARHGAFVAEVIGMHKKYGAGDARGMLELGPGDTLGAALYGAAYGMERIWLSDVGDFASPDMATYRTIAEAIDAETPGFAARVDLTDRAAMLHSLNATYLTDGTASLAAIPRGALDVILSTAVLEHVRRAEFPTLAAEMARVLRPGGIAYHQVDLMDHLGGALNNLRFGDGVWEHPLFAEAGFYTNRIRCREMVGLLQAAGFEAVVTRLARWPELPTPRAALAEPWRALADDELRIANFGVLLRKPQR
jgi:SAM-dependent methyltransferase